MEQKSDTSYLRSLLSSPARHATPAVPIPDWSTPTTSGISSMGPPAAVTPKAASQMMVLTPGSGVGDPHTNITLQNCVATLDLGCELNLMSINFRTRNSEYNPARFNGVIMRIREPRTTALIFRSGKIVCTGARNEHDALLAAKKFARIIQKLNFQVKFTKFKVQNLVATCDLRFPIKLENLNQMHGQFSSYEPELFPADRKSVV